MPLDRTFEAALHSPEPLTELRSLAMDLAENGRTREEILAAFESARQELRELNREADEDTVMDIMDFLVGWCSPHMELPPNPADRALIAPERADSRHVSTTSGAKHQAIKLIQSLPDDCTLEEIQFHLEAQRKGNHA